MPCNCPPGTPREDFHDVAAEVLMERCCRCGNLLDAPHVWRPDVDPGHELDLENYQANAAEFIARENEAVARAIRERSVIIMDVPAQLDRVVPGTSGEIAMLNDDHCEEFFAPPHVAVLPFCKFQFEGRFYMVESVETNPSENRTYRHHKRVRARRFQPFDEQAMQDFLAEGLGDFSLERVPRRVHPDCTVDRRLLMERARQFFDASLGESYQAQLSERSLTAPERRFMLRNCGRMEHELRQIVRDDPTVRRAWEEAERGGLSETSAAELALICLARENEDLRRQLAERSKVVT